MHFFTTIELCFKARSHAEAQEHAEIIVGRIKKGFVKPVIEVVDGAVFCVTMLDEPLDYSENPETAALVQRLHDIEETAQIVVAGSKEP